MSGDDRSDEEVLKESIKRPSLFAILVRRYEDAFLRKAESIVHDREEAEDVVQETFTKIYLHANSFESREGATFSSWGYRILTNTALTHWGKMCRRNARSVSLEPEAFALFPDDGEARFEQKEYRDEIASVLSRMPSALSRVLAAFLLEGKPQEEIALDEGVSVGAIKTRVHRAKREFARIYKTITA